MFPKDILEAGRIDGLSELGVFFRIYVPTMKTTYAAAAIITFMASWNNYLWPLVVLQSPENQTIPLLISTLGSSYSPDYGVIMTAIVIATLPAALIFFIMQKHFVAGMMGSVK
jgi:lactose/L-arabinose transport system permease protein